MKPRKPTILCVDDDAANLKLLENILVPRGYDVISAASGEDAMLKVRGQTIDLVLLDIIMPGTNGFDVCRKLKKDPRLRNIPVVMITVLTAKKDRILGIEAGADDFLSKPINQAEALARITILLKLKELDDERKRVEDELQKSHAELSSRVRERTAELAKANAMLQADIAERKLAVEKAKDSLVEKEMLLKEVHHRVKNNLMTIIGLIQMQETKADNNGLKILLLELEGRVRAMALVHDSLHKSENLAHINLQNYIETLCVHIHAQFGVEREIRYRVQAAGVEASLEIAVPMGLIMNELIANAYEHAFPGDKTRFLTGRCEINIQAKNEGGMLTLTVADNGIGLPVGLDWEKSDTLGMKLIRMLSRQLNGAIELDRARGTVFRLRFAYPIAGN